MILQQQQQHYLRLLISSVVVLLTWATICDSFVVPLPCDARYHHHPRDPTPTNRLGMADDDAGFTTVTTDKYDIVKVDLDNGRDYPIYIGTGYDDQEGMSIRYSTTISTVLSSTVLVAVALVCFPPGHADLIFYPLCFQSATRVHKHKQAAQLLQSHIKGTKVLLITNDRIDSLYLEKYKQLLLMTTTTNNSKKHHHQQQPLQVETLVLPDGEESKTMTVMQRILDKALECGLDRKATFVALGGGVIGDMVGFAAAIYQRGIAFVQIPTTVMAMVDSSVGGKTGVNHATLGKNMIGAFHQPNCVFIDTECLQTLPDRELQSGISEIIKYGLIRDAEFFQWQEQHIPDLLERDSRALRYAITRSCQNKAAVVKADEREEVDLRATLNLGHTFGHAIETYSGYGTFLHGEAVAIGTAMAATMSARMNWIDDTLLKRTYTLLQRANLPVELPLDSPMTRDSFLKLMSVDKKVANGKLRLILLKGPLGNCVVTGEFDHDAMISTIDDFVAECSTHNQATQKERKVA
jgi:3-dehydroquinate synthase